MYRKILVAIENSGADRTILAHVSDLARLTGAELLLVHVADGWAARHFDDLKLREEVSAERLERRAKLRTVIDEGMPELEKATAKYDLDEYYGKALGLVISGRARNAFTLSSEKKELREKYGMNTFGQSCLLARRLIEAGTRFVEVNWPKVANSDNHSWDVHDGLTKRMKDQAAPMLDAGLSALIDDLDQRGLLAETLVVAVGEFGRSPQRGVSTSGNDNNDDGRDHWPYCYTACVAGAGVRRGFVYGRSDATASAPPLASPTSCMSSNCCSRLTRPLRNSVWSSTTI